MKESDLTAAEAQSLQALQRGNEAKGGSTVVGGVFEGKLREVLQARQGGGVHSVPVIGGDFVIDWGPKEDQ